MYYFKSKTHHKFIVFLMFYIGLLLTTYLGIAEEYIIGLFILVISKGKLYWNYSNNKLWICFFGYYLFATILGFIAGFLTLKSFIQFFVQCIFLPFIVWHSIPSCEEQRKKSIICIKNFIFAAAIYGTIETIIKYNPLVHIVRINAVDWVIAMNNTDMGYQPSSFFLHYSYYGCILLVGWLFLYLTPYKKKSINLICGSLLLIQLYFTQSRICWIAAVVITFYQLDYKRMILLKTARKIIVIFTSALVIVPVLLICNSRYLQKIISTIYDRFYVLIIYGMANGSLGQRVGTLFNWPKYFKEHIFFGIFGTGFRGINEAFLNEYSYFPGYSTADCQWTTFLIETGLIGTALVVIAIIKSLSCKSRNINNEPAKRFVILFLVLSLTLDILGTNFIFVFLFWGMMLYYKKINVSNNLAER